MILIYNLVLMMMSVLPTETPKIIYIGDPMCSWCYGIAPELEKVHDAYAGQLDFELVLGGLRPYNTETMTDLAGFLKGHWEEVHEASQQPFRYGILERGDILYDTEPACRAVRIFRDFYPEKSLGFFAAVQKAFYNENKNPLLVETYIEILASNEWEIENFNALFESNKYKSEIKNDFRRSQDLGVQSFPTVLLEKDGKIHYIAKGYSTAEKMKKRIDGVLGE